MLQDCTADNPPQEFTPAVEATGATSHMTRQKSQQPSNEEATLTHSTTASVCAGANAEGGMDSTSLTYKGAKDGSLENCQESDGTTWIASTADAEDFEAMNLDGQYDTSDSDNDSGPEQDLVEVNDEDISVLTCRLHDLEQELAGITDSEGDTGASPEEKSLSERKEGTAKQSTKRSVKDRLGPRRDSHRKQSISSDHARSSTSRHCLRSEHSDQEAGDESRGYRQTTRSPRRSPQGHRSGGESHRDMNPRYSRSYHGRNDREHDQTHEHTHRRSHRDPSPTYEKSRRDHSPRPARYEHSKRDHSPRPSRRDYTPAYSHGDHIPRHPYREHSPRYSRRDNRSRRSHSHTDYSPRHKLSDRPRSPKAAREDSSPGHTPRSLRASPDPYVCEPHSRPSSSEAFILMLSPPSRPGSREETYSTSEQNQHRPRSLETSSRTCSRGYSPGATPSEAYQLRGSTNRSRHSPHRSRHSPHRSRHSPHHSIYSPHRCYMSRESPHRSRESPHRSRESPHRSREPPHRSRELSHPSRESPHRSREPPHRSREFSHPSRESPHRSRESPHRSMEPPHRSREPSHRSRESPHRSRESPHRSREPSNRSRESPHRSRESPHRSRESPYRSRESPHRSRSYSPEIRRSRSRSADCGAEYTNVGYSPGRRHSYSPRRYSPDRSYNSEYRSRSYSSGRDEHHPRHHSHSPQNQDSHHSRHDTQGHGSSTAVESNSPRLKSRDKSSDDVKQDTEAGIGGILNRPEDLDCKDIAEPILADHKGGRGSQRRSKSSKDQKKDVAVLRQRLKTKVSRSERDRKGSADRLPLDHSKHDSSKTHDHVTDSKITSTHGTSTEGKPRERTESSVVDLDTNSDCTQNERRVRKSTSRETGKNSGKSDLRQKLIKRSICYATSKRTEKQSRVSTGQSNTRSESSDKNGDPGVSNSCVQRPDDVMEAVACGQKDEVLKRHIGQLFVRGDNIVMVVLEE